MIDLSEISTPSEFAQARELFLEYAGWLGVDLCFQGFTEELDALPRMYAPPDGALVLARRDDEIAGCVAVRRFDGKTSEMKRLFVRPAARGLGIGRLLAAASVGIARRLGYRRMVLDTLEEMVAARGIYSALGFVETGPYYENPLQGVRYMELDLRAEVRAVVFDLGNTLVNYYHGPEFPPILLRSLRAVADTLGMHVEDEGDLLRRGMELNRESGTFEVRPLEERLRAIFPAADMSSDDVVAKCHRAFLAPIFARARLVDEAHAVLDELRSRGVQTALVSNTPWASSASPWRDELERHDLSRRLHAVTFCVDVGWRKPHPAPFLKTLNELSVDAAHALFVGDDPRWDQKGAWNAGMRALLLSDSQPDDGVTVGIERLRAVIDFLDRPPIPPDT